MPYQRRKVYRYPIRRYVSSQNRKKSLGSKGNYSYSRRWKVGAYPVISVSKFPFRRSYQNGGIPDVLKTKLSYICHYAVTTNGSTYEVFRADSLFDPEYAVGGAQPSYFDQLALLYNHYIVDSSAIELKIVRYNGSLSENCQGMIGVIPTNDPAYTSSPLVAGEKTYGKTVAVNLEASNASLKHYMSKQKIYGSKYDAYVAKTGVGADPTYMPFYWVVSASTGKTLTDFKFNVFIKITFYARFFNRKNPNDV